MQFDLTVLIHDDFSLTFDDHDDRSILDDDLAVIEQSTTASSSNSSASSGNKTDILYRAPVGSFAEDDSPARRSHHEPLRRTQFYPPYPHAPWHHQHYPYASYPPPPPPPHGYYYPSGQVYADAAAAQPSIGQPYPTAAASAAAASAATHQRSENAERQGSKSRPAPFPFPASHDFSESAPYEDQTAALSINDPPLPPLPKEGNDGTESPPSPPQVFRASSGQDFRSSPTLNFGLLAESPSETGAMGDFSPLAPTLDFDRDAKPGAKLNLSDSSGSFEEKQAFGDDIEFSSHRPSPPSFPTGQGADKVVEPRSTWLEGAAKAPSDEKSVRRLTVGGPRSAMGLEGINTMMRDSAVSSKKKASKARKQSTRRETKKPEAKPLAERAALGGAQPSPPQQPPQYYRDPAYFHHHNLMAQQPRYGPPSLAASPWQYRYQSPPYGRYSDQSDHHTFPSSAYTPKPSSSASSTTPSLSVMLAPSSSASATTMRPEDFVLQQPPRSPISKMTLDASDWPSPSRPQSTALRRLTVTQPVEKSPAKIPSTHAAKENSETKAQRSTEKSKRPKCNCRKTRCLKMYCECFANQLFCENCNCQECSNLEELSKIRDSALNEAILKNRSAFEQRSGGRPTCKCKKSECLKKYCEVSTFRSFDLPKLLRVYLTEQVTLFLYKKCFQAGEICGDKCKCVSCSNRAGSQKLIDKRRKMKDNKGADYAMKLAKEYWERPSSRRRAVAPQLTPHTVRMASPASTALSGVRSPVPQQLGSPIPHMSAGIVAPRHPYIPYSSSSPYAGLAVMGGMGYSPMPQVQPVAPIHVSALPGQGQPPATSAATAAFVTAPRPTVSTTSGTSAKRRLTEVVTATTAVRLDFDPAKRARGDDVFAAHFGAGVPPQTETTARTVFSFLSNEDLWAASLVCQQWNKLATELRRPSHNE